MPDSSPSLPVNLKASKHICMIAIFTCLGLAFDRVSGQELDPLRTIRADDTTTRKLSEDLVATLTAGVDSAFVVSGKTEFNFDQSAWLSVHTLDPGLPAILGEWKHYPERWVFKPRFPFQTDVVYRLNVKPETLATAVFDGNDGPWLFQSTATFTKSPPKVTAIYPSAEIVPDNLLRIYIHFSESMSRGDAYQHIHLFEGTTEIEHPFLELGEELWDSEQRRFTLLIHPGRIKRGVLPRELSGPSLEDGRQYTLQIDGNWPAADGQTLGESVLKSFRASAPQQTQLDLQAWKIDSPQRNTRNALRLMFDRALDHAMLQRVIQVKDRSGALVAGKIITREHETEWLFEPESPWLPGSYQIAIETSLEDVSGNSLARPFEVSLKNAFPPNSTAILAIEFQVH